MKLTLEVTGHTNDTDRLGADRRKTFTEEGGSIGRIPENYWRLRHDLVSKFHARIAFENGVFTIEDLDSANGTYINGSRTRMQSGVRHQIRDGDTLFIDPFTIEASVTTNAPGDQFRGAEREQPSAGAASGRGGGNPWAIVTPRTDWPPHEATPESEGSLLDEHFPLPPHSQDPSAPAPRNLVPTNYNPAESVIGPAVVNPVTPPSRHTPPSLRKAAPPSPTTSGSHAPANDDNLALLLAKAGVGRVEITPDLVETLAQVLRTVVDGLMDVFEARRRFKEELDIERSQFRPRQTTPVNNPLKFSSSVEDALTKLLVTTPPGYMGALPAFEDAFADLRNHELAMAVGIRAAFDRMLKEFNPDELQKKFDERMSGSFVRMPPTMRYWNQYRQFLTEMTNEADATSDRLLKEPFASAYKAQLERLRAAKRGAS